MTHSSENMDDRFTHRERELLLAFEQRLSARVKVPAERMDGFMRLPHEKLRRECGVVSKVLKRFAAAVAAAMENPDNANSFLDELDLKAVTRDHNWRAIFSTLRSQEAGAESYKQAVLVNYLQYLGFRKRLLEFVYARRQGLEETDGYSELNVQLEQHQGLHALPRISEQHSSDGGSTNAQFKRLVLGVPTEYRLEEGSHYDLLLAGHVFRLVGARPPCLLDQNGVMYFLRNGRNLAGRHPESDVAIDANFGNVSRAHLIIEWDGNVTVRLTDLSSRGTFVGCRPSGDSE